MATREREEANGGNGNGDGPSNAVPVPQPVVEAEGGGEATHETALDEVLDFEVHIDLARLRELASVQLPAHLRAKCYPLLLGVTPVDKTSEMTAIRRQEATFETLVGNATSFRLPRAPGTGASDAERGRALRRFLGSTAGRLLPPALRQELVRLASATGPSASGSGPSGLPSVRSQADAAPSAGASVGVTSTSGAKEHDRKSASQAAVLRLRQLVAVEALLATTTATIAPAKTYARGANYVTAWGSAADGTDGRATSRHFSEPSLEDPLAWALELTLLMGTATDSASDAFFCAEAVRAKLTQPGELWTSAGLRHTYGTFIMVLHHCVDDVYAHLHTLGVNNLRWAPALLGSLCMGRMPHQRLLELLDFYVAGFDFALHPFVCAALLDAWMEPILDAEVDDFLALMRGPWTPEQLPPDRKSVV